jgi:hypothetical protein
LDEVHVAHRSWLAALVMMMAAGAVAAVAAGRQVPPSPAARVEASTDVAWLERVASSAAAAREAQGQSRIGQPKQLRIAAYARLGALGAPESLAAIGRVERVLAAQPLLPTTVTLDPWPAVGLHMGDPPALLVAQIIAPDARTYGVASAQLLGGHDFFLLATRTPHDPTTWSRPKLIAPAAPFHYGEPASLAWAGPRRLTFMVADRTMPIVIDDVERDSDGDGWTDREEARLGTNPHHRDSDGDGIPDGRDVCPLFARPADNRADETGAILQKAIFATFAMSGSRDLLYVRPGSPRIHVAGYGGPMLYDREIPADGNGGGGTWVGWKIASRDATTASVEVNDWEGMLAAGSVDVELRKIDGAWVVVSVRLTRVS